MRYDEWNDHKWLICMTRLWAGRCRVQRYTRSKRFSSTQTLQTLRPTQPPIKWIPGLLPDDKLAGM